MAGYSGTPLPKKLGLKPPLTLVTIDAPREYLSWLYCSSPIPQISGANISFPAVQDLLPPQNITSLGKHGCIYQVKKSEINPIKRINSDPSDKKTRVLITKRITTATMSRNPMKMLFLSIPLLLVFSIAEAEIYKWKDADGKVHISDRKPETGDAEIVKIKVNTYTQVTYDKSTYDVGRKVIMYSTDWCGYCKKARAYFKKNNIPFTDHDIEKSSTARKKYEKLEATGVPVILVGDKRMNGFSENGFERIYK